jgi:hypothetical protein
LLSYKLLRWEALFYTIKETDEKGHDVMFCAQKEERDPNNILIIYSPFLPRDPIDHICQNMFKDDMRKICIVNSIIEILQHECSACNFQVS